MRLLRSLPLSRLKNKVAILRLDFNTEDNWRMDASLPTVRYLARHCAAVMIVSHKGRPKGFEEKLSLRRIARVLAGKLEQKVNFMPDFDFRAITAQVRTAPKGSIFMLENLRFLPGESKNDPRLAKQLASLGDLYINDAFAVSHRANASVVAITKYLPSYAGFEVEQEVNHLGQAIRHPKKPLVIILGGAKIDDKLRVYDNLKSKASVFLIGGALTDDIIRTLARPKIVFPTDFRTINTDIRDIGPKTAKEYCKIIRTAKTILWNGPVGDINHKRFAQGTIALARCVAKNRNSIVGGGETVMFLKKLKLDNKIGFISTGGGAMLDFIAGMKLPGLEALK
ncbi:phosphoglycerate kinase [Patescibacteria group bacterium]|nr:phosphoglycerate kinase [Patescibacteria group bacterium]